MTKSIHQITADNARAALDSVEMAMLTTVRSMRPPLWLIALCSLSLGLKTTAMGLMLDTKLWHSIQWVSFLGVVLSVAFWIARLRVKGITVKILDVRIAKTGIFVALLICVLLFLSRAVYLQSDSVLFPYIAGVLNTLILGYALRFNLTLNTKKIKDK